MDSSKGTIADDRHRALTHNAWFLTTILERIKFSNSNPPTPDNRFTTITNSDGKVVSVRDIGEQHILEDFSNRFIPSAQDYLSQIQNEEWMISGKGQPPSCANMHVKQKGNTTKKKVIPLND